jgi:type II secretory ATPase GspE/PulE/Tfp pilus assembly ATPase PilB-like protein
MADLVALDKVFERMLERQATHLHLDLNSDRSEVHVRARVKESLEDLGRLAPEAFWRLLEAAELDSAEHRLPTSGIYAHRSDDDVRAELVFWVERCPGVHGESVVLSHLSANPSAMRLPALGLSDAQAENWGALLRRNQGLVVLAGPTNSGKHTLMRALGLELAARNKVVLSIEGSNRGPLMGVDQVLTRYELGLGQFQLARAARRLDADAVLIHELYEFETVREAHRLSLEGRIVISTMHTLDAAGVLERLHYMDVEAFLVAEGLACVWAQRLLRRLCPKCRRPSSEARAALKAKGFSAEALTETATRAGPSVAPGCLACEGRGHQGMVPVVEVLDMTPPLIEALLRQESLERLRSLSREAGAVPLRTSALALAASGEVSLSEALMQTPEAR